MNRFQLAIAVLLIQVLFCGYAQAQDQQIKHELSVVTERQLGIDYEASRVTYREANKAIASMPVGTRNAFIIRTLEQVEQAEHGIMPGQLKTPKYEQIFVAATSRLYVVQMLQQMVRQAGDDYTSSLTSAVLNAEHAWLQMMLRNLLAPEDYLAMSKKLTSNLLQSMRTDTNFQSSYETLADRSLAKPRSLAYALFIISIANTCFDNSRLCDRALPE